MLQILHNPRCGKSRNCLAFFDESNTKYEVKLYLQTPLTVKELKELILKLNLKPLDLVRQKESIWIEKFKGKSMNDLQIIEAIAQNPILMERPIVISDTMAVIGRNLENLEKLR
jgi:arsenate reductase